jgi:nucleotide-binding universal stress UspA family protein
MFHKALVGIDGQAGGLDAAALARQLVAADGEVVLVHIAAGYPVAAKGETGDYERILRDESNAVLAQACAQTGVRSSVSHFSTSVGHGLRELAERESADLVVVGATRRGPAARVFIGDDTRDTLKAVRGAVAVAVAPAGYADRSPALIRKIGLAYDGSSESRAAAAAARDLALALHAELATIEVVDVPTYLLHPGKLREGAPAQAAINAATNQIAALGGSEPHVSVEDVDQRLTSTSGMVDLLVMGSPSVGLVRRLLHGSTSQDLVRGAHCAVLLLAEAVRETERSHARVGQRVAVSS